MSWERLGEAMTEIAEDYDQWRPPFSDQGGITGPIVRNIDGKRNKALFLTLTTALNRQRDAKSLYTKFGRLWDEEHWIFEPETLIEERSFEELSALFEEEGVRFGKSDAEVWYEISRTLYEDYDSDPMVLFEQCDLDMERIGTHVRNASGDTEFYDHGRKFPVLRGEKIRPLWLRLIDGYVHSLSSPESAEISVDTHIIQITNRLFDNEYTNDLSDKAEIRELWRAICEEQPVDPIDIDGALWYINRGWDDWGREYLSEKIGGQAPGGIAIPESVIDVENKQTSLENTTQEETAQNPENVDLTDHQISPPTDDVMKRTAMKVGTAHYFVAEAGLNLEVQMTDAPYHLCDGQTLAISPDELDQSSWTQWTIHQFRLILAAETMEPNGWRVVSADSIDTSRYFKLEEEHFPTLIEARDAFADEGMNKTLRDAGYHPDQIVVTPSDSVTPNVENPSKDIFVTPDGTELSVEEAARSNFDPVTGADLSGVELQSQIALAEMSRADRDAYFNDDTEYKIGDE